MRNGLEFPVGVGCIIGNNSDGQVLSIPSERICRTMREVTQSITLDVTALSGAMLSGAASGMILGTDFGFVPPSIGGVLTAADETAVTVDFVAQES